VPSVTVVIACFNLGSYLDEAVDSVLRQTYQDVEILIVDDGSDDPVTRHLLASYTRPRTRIIRTENRGVAAARNTGLSEAGGRYVSFLDADDLLEATFLERTVECLDRDPGLAFASCWLTAFGERTFSWEPTDCGFPWLLAEDTVCTAALTRRQALVAVGGFDTSARVDGYEDWELAITLVEHGYRGTIIPESLFRYRIRPGSKSASRIRPKSHAEIVEYVVDKHAETYRRHAPGVVAAIEARIAALEALLPDVPPRPSADLDRRGWRTAILDLEGHRRGLEETLEASREGPSADAGVAIVEWGSFRRLEPHSRVWGLDRGRPIDRYYIERFLGGHAASIRGDVLEVKDAGYTVRFGTEVRSSAVIDIATHNPEATLVADLSEPEALPEGRFDCFILTQTAHIIYEIHEVLRNARRALAPGGAVLATLPCVSRIDYEAGVDSDFWRLTPPSARRLFEDAFGAGNVEVEAYGNVLACTAFLQGLAVEELTPDELDHQDPYFPLIVGVCAVVPGDQRPAARPAGSLHGRLETATCRRIAGWAWDSSAPEQRLRLEIRAGDHVLGTAFASRQRSDLTEAGIANGAVAFELTPRAGDHWDPPGEVQVTPAGTHQALPSSPRALRCICSAPSEPDTPAGDDLAGAALDLPKRGEPLGFPWIEVAGWALGRERPVETVELSSRGEVFRRIPVDHPRPDLESAFPDLPWAGTAGFATRISLVAGGPAPQIEVHAVLRTRRRILIGTIDGALGRTGESPWLVLLDTPRPGQEGTGALLEQRSSIARVVVRAPEEPPGHPGFQAHHGTWDEALAVADEELVWLSDGTEPVSERFLAVVSERLADAPYGAFAAAIGPQASGTERTLAGVLAGTALGVTIAFRAESAKAHRGIDDAAPSPAAATWDLCIRLAAAGCDWTQAEGLSDRGAPTLAERVDEPSARWLYAKHRELYERNLPDVLSAREAVIAEFLRENHIAERDLESTLRPTVSARRQERARLTRRVRDLRAGRAKPLDSGGLLGELRRFEPISLLWGSERGLCIHCAYIERFLERHSEDVRGTVLECQDSVYARRYGGARVESCDVLDVEDTNPRATVVADLQRAPALQSAHYDCIVLTQVLHLMADPGAAVRECRRILKPGGVLLASVPCASRIDPEAGLDGDHWRFGAHALERLFLSHFHPVELDVRPEGNVHAVVAFLGGLAVEDIDRRLLEYRDSLSPLVVTARAVK
jgi:GT2 family glycosyltransferase/SAM-dependent methyltransferase